MHFDLTRDDIDNLLTAFLTGTQCADLQTRITDPNQLPPACRERLQLAQNPARPWTAWATTDGPIAACGDYDMAGSIRLSAYLLLVEWWTLPSGYHSAWCHCDPKRPTDWIFGRGRHDDVPRGPAK